MWRAVFDAFQGSGEWLGVILRRSEEGGDFGIAAHRVGEDDTPPVGAAFEARGMGGQLNPQRLFYDVQKAKMRVTRVIEGIEGLLAGKPGQSLRVQFGGTERLKTSIGLASRRLSVSLAMSGAFAITAAANAPRVPRWVPALTGAIGSALAAGLISDQVRQRD